MPSSLRDFCAIAAQSLTATINSNHTPHSLLESRISSLNSHQLSDLHSEQVSTPLSTRLRCSNLDCILYSQFATPDSPAPNLYYQLSSLDSRVSSLKSLVFALNSQLASLNSKRLSTLNNTQLSTLISSPISSLNSTHHWN